MNRHYYPLHDHLTEHAVRNLGEEARGDASLLCGVIVQSIEDAHNSKDEECRKSAVEFFQSDKYRQYEEWLGLNPIIMAYMIDDPDHIIGVLVSFKSSENDE